MDQEAVWASMVRFWGEEPSAVPSISCSALMPPPTGGGHAELSLAPSKLYNHG